MSEYFGMRKNYEERKVHRFLNFMDTATFYLAVAAMACGAIILIEMAVKIMERQ